MTAAEQAPATVTALVDPATLTHAQTGGWDCVHCGRRLGDDGQRLGTVTVKRGSARVLCEVWECVPACGAKPNPEPASTAWSRFLDHAVGCSDCRTPDGCETGKGLLDAYRDACRAERNGDHAHA